MSKVSRRACDAERRVPIRALDRLLPRLEPALPRIEHRPGDAARSPAPPHRHADGALAPTSPRRRERLASPAMPAMNSSEKPCRRPPATPSASRPCRVNATCSAVSGGGSVLSALVTGAFCSQRCAASRSATSSRRKQASRQPPVAEAHEALHVAEVDPGRLIRGGHRSGPHKRLSHSLASVSVIARRSMPSRIRVLRSQIDHREARIGIVPDVGRQLVAPEQALVHLLVPGAALDQPVGARVADAVAEDEIDPPGDLVDEVVHVALDTAVVIAGEEQRASGRPGKPSGRSGSCCTRVR